MPTYVIGGQKGGTGKSTLATNLAVSLTLQKRSVLLIDSDRQQTASHWGDKRQADTTLPPITTIQKTGRLFQVIRDMEGRYDDVLIDVGGYDSVELRTALAAADYLYSPVRASQSDLWTLEAMEQLLGEAKELNPALEAFLILSMAPTNPVIRETQEAIALLAEYPTFGICRTVIRDRKAFRDAMFRGRGVVELSDPKSTTELSELAEEVTGHALRKSA